MARMKPRFTADEVWYELGASFPVTKGMTARLMVAERRGVIKNTGEILRTQNVAANTITRNA
jgi:hypothetical protein